LGGAVVGLLTAFGYICVIIAWALLKADAAPRTTEKFTVKERLQTMKLVVPATVLAASVFGGLFSGLFTPTEAGAVGSMLAILISIALRTVSWKALRTSLIEAFMTSAALFVIAIGAKMLTRFVALSGADDAIAVFIVQASSDPVILFLIIALVYLVLGMFLEPTGALLLTLPILIPVAQHASFDMIWFGIIVIKLLEIGMVTPPVGLNVFVIKSVVGTKISIATIFRGVSYFLIADIIILGLIFSFPNIVLFLPSLL